MGYLKISEKLNHELALGRAHNLLFTKQETVQVVAKSKVMQSVVTIRQKLLRNAAFVALTSKQLPASAHLQTSST